MNKRKYSIKIIWICLIFILGLLIIHLGGSLNHITIKVNSGKMPVKAPPEWIPDEYKNTHFAYTYNEEVKLWWATDIFYGTKSIYSIGDVIVRGGYLIFVVWVIVGNFLLIKLIKELNEDENL